jgi:hypothetical protein
MIKSHNFKIILLLIAIIIEVAVLLFSMNQLGFFSKGLNEKKCYNLPEGGFGPGATDTIYLDCIGYLRIEQSNTADLKSQLFELGNVWIDDTKFSLVFITKVEAYHIENNFLYVIGNLDYNVYESGDKKGEAFSHIPINGKLQFVDFASSKDVPHYFKINGETGDMTLYKDFNEMNDAEKVIFKDLDANKKDYVQEFKKESQEAVLILLLGGIDFIALLFTIILFTELLRGRKPN